MNPNKYPGFAFAWLELISHKQFLINFLKNTTGTGANQSPSGSKKPSNPTPAQQADQTLFQKWIKIKELLVHLFSFLKYHMV